MPDPLADTVIAALAEVKHVAPERISIDSTFAELSVDPLDAITLLFELEARLDIADARRGGEMGPQRPRRRGGPEGADRRGPAESAPASQ